MKILQIIAGIDITAGGPSRSVPLICKQLAQLGINIEMITQSTSNPVKVETSSNFQIQFLKFLQVFYKFFSYKLFKADIIHLQHIWSLYLHIFTYIARWKNIPYVISPRGMLEPWIMQHNWCKKKLGMFLFQKRDIKKAFCIHATAQQEMESIRNLGFKNPIAIIPNGIDLAEIPDIKSSCISKKVIFLSRIHVKKGIEVLLDAWAIINTQSWTLEIAGDGDRSYIQQLKESITKLKLTNVQIIEPVYGKQKWEFLASGSVFVLPTYSENFGNVIVEAIAMGLPVITTKGTPWQELELHQCGWWIDLTIQNLANTLEKAINTPPNELQEMGLRGKQLITQNYDIKQVAQKMKLLYEWILGKNSIPDFVFIN